MPFIWSLVQYPYSVTVYRANNIARQLSSEAYQNDSRRVENTSSLYETEELFAVNDVYINIAESKRISV